MVEAIQTLHLPGGATKLMAAFCFLALQSFSLGEVVGSPAATGAHVALANAAGLKVLFFCFFFSPQIYQIPRCLTLKQRLQTLPTSRPEISQVGGSWCFPPPWGAGGRAGQQEGTGVLTLLLACALGVKRRTQKAVI